MYKAITYNHLNQPAEVDFGTKKTVYTYTATGGMLKTEIYSGTTLKSSTEYCGAFVYEDNKLSFINIPGGRIVNHQLLIAKYEYNLTDHLGNVRVTFAKNETTGNAEIIQEDHYYPFGMRMSGQHFTNTELLNKFLYNGKELQDQTGYYDYLPTGQAGGFRQLDPQLGRWHVIDAMAEKYMSTSPYAYVMNNPISSVDVMGLYRGGGKQWRSYPKPYLDSNSSRNNGGMIYQNNMPGSLAGLNTAYLNNPFRDLGGHGEDEDEDENDNLFISCSMGSSIVIDVLTDESADITDLLDAAVDLINSIYEELNVNLTAEWQYIEGLDDIKGKEEFYGRSGADENDSYVVATTEDRIGDVFNVMTGRGWRFGTPYKDEVEGYVGNDADQVAILARGNGFSFHDKAAIINLNLAKLSYNRTWIKDKGMIEVIFDSGSQKLGMTIMHETGHAKFRRLGNHIPGTIMGEYFYKEWGYNQEMINILQNLHGKINP